MGMLAGKIVPVVVVVRVADTVLLFFHLLINILK